jgi:hypothetical protein
MTDLDRRFRSLDGLRSPDLWTDIESREPRPMPSPGPGRRIAVAAVALVVAAGGALLAVWAFTGGEPRPRPSAEPAVGPGAPVEAVVGVTLPIEYPTSIAYGEGSVWAAASANDGTGAGTIYRLDPDTAEIQAEIPVPSVPSWEVGGGGMVADGGSLWIAGYQEEGSQGALIRIDTGSNRVADVIPLGGQFAGEVAVDEHSIWVTVFGQPSVELVRLNPETLVSDIGVSLDVDWAREILTVDGHVWVRTTQGALSKIEPTTGKIVQEVDLPGGVTSLTTFQGTIWATTWKASEGNLLARIDPATGNVSLLPSGEFDNLLEAGPSGLWGRWDPRGGSLGVARFDPVRGRINASVGLDPGSLPNAMAVAPGSVWVADYDEGVTRIELRPA